MKVVLAILALQLVSGGNAPSSQEPEYVPNKYPEISESETNMNSGDSCLENTKNDEKLDEKRDLPNTKRDSPYADCHYELC